MMNAYSQAIEWLNQRPRKTWPNLDRTKWLINHLGQPNKGLPLVHIAGTNGKGSTVATLASLAQAHGLSVGAFTSPHIHRYNERVKLNGQDISDEDFIKYLSQIQALMPELIAQGFENLTQFECLFTIALLYYADCQPDMVLIEVGIGGSHDTTNVIVADLAILTTVGMDHQDILGETIEEIAEDKAGVIKPGSQAVIGRLTDQAKIHVLAKGKEVGAELFWNENDFSGQLVELRDNTQSFTYQFKDINFKQLAIPLLGQHQVDNVANALTAFILFAKKHKIKLSEEKIRQGLMQISWPGRFEILSEDPYLVLDGAHNREAVIELVKTADQHFDNQKQTYLFAGLNSKPIHDMIEIIEGNSKHQLILTTFDFPNAMTIKDFEEELDHDYLFKEDWQAVIDTWSADQGPLIVCGSLYFISQVRSYYFNI